MATQKETVDEHAGMLREHVRLLATSIERVDGVRADMARIEQEVKSATRQLRSIEKLATETAGDSVRFEKRMDDLSSRRFEIGKMIVAAILGGLMTLIVGWSLRLLERSFSAIPPESSQSRP